MLGIRSDIPNLGSDVESGPTQPLNQPQWTQEELDNPDSFANSGLTREEYDAETLRLREKRYRLERWIACLDGPICASLILFGPPAVLIAVGTAMLVKLPEYPNEGRGVLGVGVTSMVCCGAFWVRELYRSRRDVSAFNSQQALSRPQ